MAYDYQDGFTYGGEHSSSLKDLFCRCHCEGQNIAGILILGNSGAGYLDERAVLVLAGAALGVTPQGVHGIALIFSLAGCEGCFVQYVSLLVGQRHQHLSSEHWRACGRRYEAADLYGSCA